MSPFNILTATNVSASPGINSCTMPFITLIMHTFEYIYENHTYHFYLPNSPFPNWSSISILVLEISLTDILELSRF